MLFLESDSRVNNFEHSFFVAGGGTVRNDCCKQIDSTFMASPILAFSNRVGEVRFLLYYYGVISDNACEYYVGAIIKMKACFKIPALGALKKNSHLQRSVTDEPHLVSKNVRGLRCRKFYPEYFSIEVFLQKKKKKKK